MLRSEKPFHPEATKDYEEAYIWYFAHGSGLAAEFEREIERGLGLIADNPFGGQNSTLSVHFDFIIHCLKYMASHYLGKSFLSTP